MAESLLKKALRLVPGTKQFTAKILEDIQSDLTKKEDIKLLELFSDDSKPIAQKRLKSAIDYSDFWFEARNRMSIFLGVILLIIFFAISLLPHFLFIDIPQEFYWIPSFLSISISVAIDIIITFVIVSISGVREKYKPSTTLYTNIVLYTIATISVEFEIYNDYVSRILFLSFSSSLIMSTFFLIIIIICNSVLNYPKNKKDSEKIMMSQYYYLNVSLKSMKSVADMEANREYFLEKIDFISNLYNHPPFCKLDGQNRELRLWYRKSCSEWARAIMNKKRNFLIPKPSTLQEIQSWSQSQLVAIVLGHWEEVEREEINQIDNRTTLAKALDWLKTLAIAALFPAILWFISFYFPKVSIPDAYNFAAAGWALFIVASRIDPQISDKIAAFKQTFENLQTLRSKDP